jgi:hypothetical protein
MVLSCHDSVVLSPPNLLWSPRNQPQIREPKLHRFSPFQGAVSLILNDLRKNGNRQRFPATGGLPSRLLITPLNNHEPATATTEPSNLNSSENPSNSSEFDLIR